MRKGIKRAFKWLAVLLVVLGVIQGAQFYAVLHPEHFFEYSEEFGSFRVFSSRPISPGLEGILREVSKRVEKSEAYSAGDLTKIVFANDGLYFALAGKSRIPRTIGNCIIAGGEVEVGRNRLVLPAVEMNLTYILAHEAVHVGQHKHYGYFMGSALDFGRHPSWKTEGYAEWVAQQDRISQDATSIKNALIALGRYKPDQWVDLGDGYVMPWSYLRARIMIEYLIKVEGMSYTAIMDAEISESELWQKIKDAERSRR